MPAGSLRAKVHDWQVFGVSIIDREVLRYQSLSLLLFALLGGYLNGLGLILLFVLAHYHSVFHP